MGTSPQIAFIDLGIPDVAGFAAGLEPGIESVLLDSSRAASAQIARALSGRNDIQCITRKR